LAELQVAVTSALGHGYFSLSGFSQKIPLSLLPGCLDAGAAKGEANVIPWWDVRYGKELESAIRHHASTGEAGFHPRIVARDFITSRRIPWLGDLAGVSHFGRRRNQGCFSVVRTGGTCIDFSAPRALDVASEKAS
jgi:hypothetical protein